MSDSNSDSASDDGQHKKSKIHPKAKTGSATYQVKFKKEWQKIWPSITAGTTPHYFWCNICRVERKCSHMGKRDIIRHINSDGHQKKQKDIQTNQSVKSHFQQRTTMTPLETKVILITNNFNITCN